jgi:hypothetical protein
VWLTGEAVSRRLVSSPLSLHYVLNLEYRKSGQFFCISRNCDGCFLTGFVSGTFLAQKHRDIAGLGSGQAGSGHGATG